MQDLNLDAEEEHSTLACIWRNTNTLDNVSISTADQISPVSSRHQPNNLKAYDNLHLTLGFPCTAMWTWKHKFQKC